MTGEQLVPLPQEEAWRALNDTQILKECIPGCESLEKISENQYQLVMLSKIGPVSARFKGLMTLEDVDAPRSYRMVFEGQGGVAGFAKGQATVTLAPEGDGTMLSYAVKAMIGGKLAQLGARLIDGVARKLSADFFRCFNERLSKDGAQLLPGEAESMLKIWGRTNSINVQKVLWTCGELGLKYDRVDAGLQFGVNNTP